MPSKKSDVEKGLVANSLISWKSVFDIVDDPYVEGLLDSLNSGQDLQFWATLNPLEYLPHPEVSKNARSYKILFIFAMIRNALVFSPVALTWLAISKATSAFSSYTTDNSLTVVNFLDFWENGYGVLSKNWSLSRVATLDFQIILLIISLTIFIGAFEKRLNGERARIASRIDSERVQIALQIDSYLFKQRKITPQIFNASTNGILRNLVITSKSMEKASRDFSKIVISTPLQRDIFSELKEIRRKISKVEE